MCSSLEKSVQVAEAELWKTAKKMEGKKIGFYANSILWHIYFKKMWIYIYQNDAEMSFFIIIIIIFCVI